MLSIFTPGRRVPSGVAPPHFNMSGILLRVPNAQPDEKNNFSSRRTRSKEQLIRTMEIPANSDTEERIAALERRIRDMEALVRGLTAELLDLKKVATGMSRQEGERSRQDLKKGTVVRGTIAPELAGTSGSPAITAPAEEKVVIRPKGADKPEETAAPEEPKVRIMQSDGTFKLEARRGNRKMI